MMPLYRPHRWSSKNADRCGHRQASANPWRGALRGRASTWSWSPCKTTCWMRPSPSSSQRSLVRQSRRRVPPGQNLLGVPSRHLCCHRLVPTWPSLGSCTANCCLRDGAATACVCCRPVGSGRYLSSRVAPQPRLAGNHAHRWNRHVQNAHGKLYASRAAPVQNFVNGRPMSSRPSRTCIRQPCSILRRRLLHVRHHHLLQWSLAGLQLQSHLLH